MTPFYDLALKLFTRTQRSQIQKGIEKYPEPFNPRSWTPDELLQHALEETVDLTHYLVGLKTLLDDKDKENQQLKHQLALAQGELSIYRAMENMNVTIASSPRPPIEWIPKQFLAETKKLPANFEGKVVGTPIWKKPPYADLDDE